MHIQCVYTTHAYVLLLSDLGSLYLCVIDTERVLVQEAFEE